MADSQLSLTISLIFVALFMIAILGFGIGFANDNSATVSIADDPDINEVRTNTSNIINQLDNESEGTYESILETTIEPGSDVMPSAGPISGTRGGLIRTGKNAIILPLKKIFGGQGSQFGIFFTAFFVIIALMFALYLIKTWRGNP